MNNICRQLYKAISEKKWLSIEYHNLNDEQTRYWIAIKSINPQTATATVEGFHVFTHQIAELNLKLDRIMSAAVLDGSYYEGNEELAQDINDNPEKYAGIFDSVANLKILNYLSECNKLDTTPYKTDYVLVDQLDDADIYDGRVHLNEEQFNKIVWDFQNKAGEKKQTNRQIVDLGMNLLSINTKRGLYVLAYKQLKLDVKRRVLAAVDAPVICKEFTINGYKESIRSYISEEDMYLLEDFDSNAEIIRNLVTDDNPDVVVDDMPYIVAIGRDCILDLDSEYTGISKMYASGDERDLSLPIKAFFGDMTVRSQRRKSYPFVLVDQKINLDQLLAMNNAMRYPVAYIQGPPGTGKTQTIVNTIITAFFNDRTVLFSSNNNHPIDGVVQKIRSLKYRDNLIPFPIIRLGNNEEVAKSIELIKQTFNECMNMTVYDSTLNKNRADRAEKAKALTKFLEKYEDYLDLLERKEAIESLLERSDNMNFQLSLQTGQLEQVKNRIAEMGKFDLKEALGMITENGSELMKYLYYTSIKFIKRLAEPKYRELMSIIYMEDPEKKVKEFNHYLTNQENLKSFLRVFPVVATTCHSAHRLGESQPLFDMVIIDEASQCNTAVSLVPIIRGYNLMLVGDPQQLNPVVLLSEADNEKLKKKYNVPEEYDYIKNSLYKTFLACDSVNDEVLLRNHYRCDPKIIGFNNKKYYNSKLKIESNGANEHPLIFMDVQNDTSLEKNIAPAEIDAINQIIKDNPGRQIGIITPFTRQRQAILDSFEKQGIKNVECGTVHAFQGDEKDIIVFSLALTDYTKPRTYEWLKNNRELINVATSRAVNQLYVVGSRKELERLNHGTDGEDIFELMKYVSNNGQYEVSRKLINSRALGIRPYSTDTENAFMTTLNHALGTAFNDGNRYVIHREVPISQVFMINDSSSDFFYKGRFDFVVYRQIGNREIPILAIELDGKEHHDSSVVMMRDKKKEQICHEHGFELIRVENTYARRYHYIKEILADYFAGK